MSCCLLSQLYSAKRVVWQFSGCLWGIIEDLLATLFVLFQSFSLFNISLQLIYFRFLNCLIFLRYLRCLWHFVPSSTPTRFFIINNLMRWLFWLCFSMIIYWRCSDSFLGSTWLSTLAANLRWRLSYNGCVFNSFLREKLLSVI